MARIDVAIVWDTSLTPERPGFPLFSEEVFPVCSPRYLQQNPAIDGSVEALAATDLIHFDAGDSGFITWRLWFAAQGIDYRPPAKAHQYDAPPFSMQAVLNGEGMTNRKVAHFLQYLENRPN